MDFTVSGNAPQLFPAETFFGLIYCSKGDAVEIPYQYPLQGEWGKPLSSVFEEPQDHDIPQKIDLVYLSIIEEKFYSLSENIPCDIFQSTWECIQKSTSDEIVPVIVVGLAPNGFVAMWSVNNNKSLLVNTYLATEISVPICDFFPASPQISLREICNRYLNNNLEAFKNLEKNGLPPRDLFDRYMQQFNYRYVVEFGHWDEGKKEWKDYENDEVRPEFEYIEEALYDGTHDKLHDGGLMQYHQAGKPKKLALQYHIKKSVYSVYLWFDDFKIRAAFENFYREYPEAEMDFLFRIDPEKNIYQILFTCKEAEQPLLLNEEAYQMIVFKSKFERYRTQNYNQPRGAWIW